MRVYAGFEFGGSICSGPEFHEPYHGRSLPLPLRSEWHPSRLFLARRISLRPQGGPLRLMHRQVRQRSPPAPSPAKPVGSGPAATTPTPAVAAVIDAPAMRPTAPPTAAPMPPTSAAVVPCVRARCLAPAASLLKMLMCLRPMPAARSRSTTSSARLMS
jgi:hypothetical protein